MDKICTSHRETEILKQNSRCMARLHSRPAAEMHADAPTLFVRRPDRGAAEGILQVFLRLQSATTRVLDKLQLVTCTGYPTNSTRLNGLPVSPAGTYFCLEPQAHGLRPRSFKAHQPHKKNSEKIVLTAKTKTAEGAMCDCLVSRQKRSGKGIWRCTLCLHAAAVYRACILCLRRAESMTIVECPSSYLVCRMATPSRETPVSCTKTNGRQVASCIFALMLYLCALSRGSAYTRNNQHTP